MRKRLMCIVGGRVHGVFFRDATARRACSLRLTGFVQNEVDGTVRIVAEGDETALNELLAYVRTGPPFAKVERVEEAWGDAAGEFADFRIHYHNFFDHF